MHCTSARPCVETLPLPFRDQFGRWPIGAKRLVSLIDLGWSDYCIAYHFGVEAAKVSALRAYYGLVQHGQESWISRTRRKNRLPYER